MDEGRCNPLFHSEARQDDRKRVAKYSDLEKQMTARIDIGNLLKNMPNKRYEYVIRRLVLQDAEPKEVAKELCTNVDNLYNIKKRAIAALTESALKEFEKYGQKGEK